MTSPIRQCRHGRSSFDSILSDMAILTFSRFVGCSLASRALNPRGSGNRGGPERTRTSDLRFRKPLLYPTELRDHYVDVVVVRVAVNERTSSLRQHACNSIV